MTDVSPVFPLAAAFISEGWERYLTAARGDTKVSPNAPDATGWDLVGALLAAAEELELIEEWPSIEKRVNATLRRAYGPVDTPGPMSWNMFRATDERSVLRLLAEAFNG